MNRYVLALLTLKSCTIDQTFLILCVYEFQLFLQSLADLQPKFNSNIERELFIEIRLASVPSGFSYLQQRGFLSTQMDYWAVEFNYRFVSF